MKYTEEERLEYAMSHEETWPGNEIHDSVEMSSTCMIRNNGFGWVRTPSGELYKMPHQGNVVIEKNVNIGANTCIDRAVEGSTVIGEGTKIDNLVHIAHGAKIGKHCIIVAGAVVGGSAEIGDYCYIGMGALIKNKVKIGNNVTIGMGAVVLKDVPDGVTVVGNPAKELKPKV